VTRQGRASGAGSPSVTLPHPALLATLAESQAYGFLGPGPLEAHLRHAEAFLAAVALVTDAEPRTVLDLGSGGGVPGLVLACLCPAASVTLVDSQRRRTDFLARAAGALGSPDRIRVVLGRAEALGRGALRHSQQLVVARSFGPPAVTAECGASFLQPGGWLAVAEPPGGGTHRWPPDPLAELGLREVGLVTRPAAVRIFLQERALDERYPRRTGVPVKRPLWEPPA
jgi:16S rRNA (guanine527-N7)-methyltransferase